MKIAVYTTTTKKEDKNGEKYDYIFTMYYTSIEKALKSYELGLNKIEGESLNKLSEDHYYGSGLNGGGEWVNVSITLDKVY